ncbi:hypothetical protein [Cellulomonas iranensis]|uniref:hypothetical protein n=1 Tax=Cellulomonas iranensis TaxID=76862 RepID=UPI003D7EA27D
MEHQVEVRLPARVHQEGRSVGGCAVGDLVEGVARVLEAQRDVVGQTPQAGLDVALDVRQVLGADPAVGVDPAVDDDVPHVDVAGDVDPPVLLVVHAAQDEEDVELVLHVPGQAVVVARLLEVVDEEPVDELVVDAVAVGDELGRLGGRQHDRLAGRQVVERLLELGEVVQRER